MSRCVDMRARLVLVAAAGCVASSAVVTFGALAAQPADKHSFLIQNGGKGIRDDDFANIMKDALVKNGAANTEGAKFLFQQCFGGGMLDDLDTAFGNTVKWIGASASKWDEPSIGTVSTAENNARPAGKKYDNIWVANPPDDFWTRELWPELGNEPQTLKQIIDKAEQRDTVGPNGKAPYGAYETPQSTFKNGGDALSLKDANAKSFHAVLWAGAPDAQRHANDIDNVYKQLVTVWGNPDVPANNITIDILYADGTASFSGKQSKPATRDQLVTTMNEIKGKLNADEEFFFYASDHGGDSTTIQEKPPVVPKKPVQPKFRDLEFCSLVYGELQGMLYDEQNVPLLTVDYSDVVSPDQAPVYWNNVLLGYLLPGLTTMDFVVPESLLQLGTNEVAIDNTASIGTLPFYIEGKSFFTGAISTLVGVPEPGGFALIGIAFVAVARRGRR